MKLNDWITEKRGRASELARRLDVKHSTVLRWASGVHAPTLAKAAAIERETFGAVCVADLMPSPPADAVHPRTVVAP